MVVIRCPRIARRQYGTSEADRAMIAIYRGNEHAFEGNINRLRAGAVLRLPDNTAVASVDLRDAQAEIRRQAASWTRADVVGNAPAAADARLRLIPPATPGAAGGASAEAQALRDQVAKLENQIAESRRLLDIQSAELSRLKGGAAPVPAPAAPDTAPTPPAVSHHRTRCASGSGGTCSCSRRARC